MTRIVEANDLQELHEGKSKAYLFPLRYLGIDRLKMEERLNDLLICSYI